MSQTQADRILRDVRLNQDGKFEVTYSDFIQFLTRRRVNVAMLEKGAIDPILAATSTHVQQIRDQYDLTYEQIFQIFAS